MKISRGNDDNAGDDVVINENGEMILTLDNG